MQRHAYLLAAVLSGACLLLGAWTAQPTNQPTELAANRPASPELYLANLAAPATRSACVRSGLTARPTCPEPTDISYEVSSGGCQGEDIWYLQFHYQGGDVFYDEPDLTVGCRGGHKLCSDGCAFEPAEPVHPPQPVMHIDDVDHTIYYTEVNVVLEPPANYCDAPADTCWNDVNTDEEVVGFQMPFDPCDQ